MGFNSTFKGLMLERKRFQTNVVEKTKTHILFSLTIFYKIVPFMR